MATYECSVCGMAVNATCAKCDEPLVNDMLTLDNGNEVQISKCPNDHGKIKSPLCCGQDMACTAWLINAVHVGRFYYLISWRNIARGRLCLILLSRFEITLKWVMRNWSVEWRNSSRIVTSCHEILTVETLTENQTKPIIIQLLS